MRLGLSKGDFHKCMHKVPQLLKSHVLLLVMQQGGDEGISAAAVGGVGESAAARSVEHVVAASPAGRGRRRLPTWQMQPGSALGLPDFTLTSFPRVQAATCGWNRSES